MTEETGPARHHAWVVIVTWNSGEDILPCLDRVMEAIPPERIVVVDNASADGTPGRVRERHPGIHVIETGANLGFGRGCNVGMSHALDRGARFVFHVNDDALTPGPALEALLDAAERHPEYGILFPINLDAEGGEIDRLFLGELLLHAGRRGRNAMTADGLLGRLRDVYPVTLLPGAVMLLRRECLERVGGYDPIYFIYGTEYDLCRRARAKGWRVGLVPGSVIAHGYVRPPPPTFRARVAKSVSDSYSIYLLSAKRIGRPFLLGVVEALAIGAFRTAGALLGERSPATAAGVLIALPWFLTSLPRVWRHRRRCRTEPFAFIHDDTHTERT